MAGPTHAAGYVFSHRVNNGFILVNRLLKQGCDVYWLKTPPAVVSANDLGTGAVWVPASAAARTILEQGAKQLGVNVYGIARRPVASEWKLKPVRIGLFDQYGGLMPSGWTRWIFEQFEFPFKVVYPQELDAGNLAAKYDVLVFTDGAIRAQGEMGRPEGFMSREPKAEDIPVEYRSWLGRVTTEKTIPQIRAFVAVGWRCGRDWLLDVAGGLSRFAAEECLNGAGAGWQREAASAREVLHSGFIADGEGR